MRNFAYAADVCGCKRFYTADDCGYRTLYRRCSAVLVFFAPANFACQWSYTAELCGYKCRLVPQIIACTVDLLRRKSALRCRSSAVLQNVAGATKLLHRSSSTALQTICGITKKLHRRRLRVQGRLTPATILHCRSLRV